MPDGPQTWAKDAGGPPCPRKEAKLPPAGSRLHENRKKLPREDLCYVSAALSGLAISAPA